MGSFGSVSRAPRGQFGKDKDRSCCEIIAEKIHALCHTKSAGNENPQAGRPRRRDTFLSNEVSPSGPVGKSCRVPGTTHGVKEVRSRTVGSTTGITFLKEIRLMS